MCLGLPRAEMDLPLRSQEHGGYIIKLESEDTSARPELEAKVPQSASRRERIRALPGDPALPTAPEAAPWLVHARPPAPSLASDRRRMPSRHPCLMSKVFGPQGLACGWCLFRPCARGKSPGAEPP